MPPKGKAKAAPNLSTQSAPALTIPSPKTRQAKLRALANVNVTSQTHDASRSSEPAASGAGIISPLNPGIGSENAELNLPAASSARLDLPAASSAGNVPAAHSAGESAALPTSLSGDGTARVVPPRYTSQIPVQPSLKPVRRRLSFSRESSGLLVPTRAVPAITEIPLVSPTTGGSRNRQVSIEEVLDVDAPRIRGSPTPSLNSLLHNASDTTTEHSLHYEGAGVYDDESISQGLAKNRLLDEYDEIFTGVAREINIHDEPLVASVSRYSPRYDPLVDNDPLYAYGAEDGILPGRSLNELMLLRDVIVRWTTPH